MIYLLLIMGVLVLHQVYNYVIRARVTRPPVGDYLYLTKSLMQSRDNTQDNNVKTQFMEFVVALGNLASDNHTGVGYFWLPQLGSVYVLTNPTVVKQFYEKKNSSNFSQLPFFNRLSLILGPDNLMSSPLYSSIHTSIRKSILNRNEKFIPYLADLVKDFFVDYAKQKKVMPLGEVMNALSRRVLLTTYFDKCVVEAFERNYDPKLTEALLLSIFELETTRSSH